MALKIHKLQSQISEIDALLKMDRKDPHFNAWVSKTERVLWTIFWDESIQLKNYKDVTYTCWVYYHWMPDSDKINAHIRGLNEAKILLDGMTDEIDDDSAVIISYDFWPMIDKRIVSVSKRLFDDKHFSPAIFEAMKLVNNTVKDEVKWKGKWEYDGSPLMDRAFSINDPIISFWDTSTTTGKDIQQWYMHLYKWAMLAIRNPKWHDNVIISKERAIHFIFIANHLLLQLNEKIN